MFAPAYRRRIATGGWCDDPAQGGAVEALSRLEAALRDAARPRLLGAASDVKGVYLWGPVGVGKSALMDLFFEAAPETRKRRVHFHVFMGEIHRLVNAWREGDAGERRRVFGRTSGDDPIAPVARLIAREARLLCFDELEVTDIADAMILGRLFEALFAAGMTLVANSNRPPDDLYLDGINRALFIPFIDMLKARTQVVPVAGARDYRLERLRAAGTWFSPIDGVGEAAFDSLWRAMGPEDPGGVTLEVLGRRLHWPRAAGGRLRAHFASLCVHALGAPDYVAIAQRFGTVFVEAIPRLGPGQRDAARRLAILIDTLYEARARLVVLADGEPADLYPQGDKAFEFQRTVSRLNEMRSAGWLKPSPV
ncbi:MAG TPA: cell division protein ZapE [Caulobacteraceae bacterium]